MSAQFTPEFALYGIARCDVQLEKIDDSLEELEALNTVTYFRNGLVEDSKIRNNINLVKLQRKIKNLEKVMWQSLLRKYNPVLVPFFGRKIDELIRVQSEMSEMDGIKGEDYYLEYCEEASDLKIAIRLVCDAGIKSN